MGTGWSVLPRQIFGADRILADRRPNVRMVELYPEQPSDEMVSDCSPYDVDRFRAVLTIITAPAISKSTASTAASKDPSMNAAMRTAIASIIIEILLNTSLKRVQGLCAKTVFTAVESGRLEREI